MINYDKEVQSSELKGSLLLFTQVIFKHLTAKDFIVSNPIGRESHHVTICKAFTELFYNQKPAHGLVINIPPGYGKSVMTCMFVAWCFAHYPDCNFLYVSYAYDLAASHTAFIKTIMTSKLYQYLFDVKMSTETRSKGNFKTVMGGEVCAFGSGGPITGKNAGLPGVKRFSGLAIVDDAHKPDEVHSDSMRGAVIRNYQETLLQRPRDTNVSMLYIGQRLREEDLASYLLSGQDVRKWETIILPGLDEAQNALYPEVQTREYLLELAEKQPYVFAAQIQQSPIPAGGALFKPEWFAMLYEDPVPLCSFIVADTAETAASYNDASAFSFFSLYEIESLGVKTGQYGIHWIDTLECRVEPKDLKATFLDFWAVCMQYKCPPSLIAIEKKSTGGTLLSLIDDIRTVRLIDIKRYAGSGNKTKRFLDIQPYVAERRVSFTEGARHVKLCKDHMSKITANETHRWDDIADTLSDAIRMALIDKTLSAMYINKTDYNNIATDVTRTQNKINQLRQLAYKR